MVRGLQEVGYWCQCSGYIETTKIILQPNIPKIPKNLQQQHHNPPLNPPQPNLPNRTRHQLKPPLIPALILPPPKKSLDPLVRFQQTLTPALIILQLNPIKIIVSL